MDSPKANPLQPPELPSEIKPEHIQEESSPAPSETKPVNDGMFNEEDVNNLWDIFNLFDKDKTGRVTAEDLKAILTSLKREHDEAIDMLSQMKVNTEEGVTFDQFLELMRKIEVKIEKKEEVYSENVAGRKLKKEKERTMWAYEKAPRYIVCLGSFKYAVSNKIHINLKISKTNYDEKISFYVDLLFLLVV